MNQNTCSILIEGFSQALKLGNQTEISSSQFTSSYLNYTKSIIKKSFSKAKSIAAEAGFPLEQMMIDFGAEYSSQGWENYKKEVEKVLMGATSSMIFKTRTIERITEISAGVVKTCLVNNVLDGLSIISEPSSDHTSLHFTAYWNPPRSSSNGPIEIRLNAELPLTWSGRMRASKNFKLKIGNGFGDVKSFMASRDPMYLDESISININPVGSSFGPSDFNSPNVIEFIARPKINPIPPGPYVYKITTKTGAGKHHGTDDAIFCKLFGKNGSTRWISLDNLNLDDREKGATNNFFVKTNQYLGEITHVQLKAQISRKRKIKGNKYLDDWTFTYIEVRNLNNNQKYSALKTVRVGDGKNKGIKIPSSISTPKLELD